MVVGPTPEKATKGVPDRWLHCPKTGNLIMDQFFPFKTPLCALYDNQIPDKKLRFHVKDVFSNINLGGRRIGLWIDLTKTDRYYFREEVTETNCIYKKIPLVGHNASPSEEETNDFISVVSNFRRTNPNDIIGVHCTHGFNRTGFLIAAYLFSIEGWGIDAAISEFAQNRNNGIYKQDYINDLFDRYGEEDDDRIEAPPRPTWDDPVGSIIESTPSTSNINGANQNGVSSSKNSSSSNGKQFMDGLVKGVTIVEDMSIKSMLRAKIKAFCKYERDGFPGLQPVSLSRKNMSMLENEPYMVSWKADGMRYMVLIFGKDEVYAFDRDNEVFQIQGLDFPAKNGGYLKNTLVDSEMIIDKVNMNGKIRDVPRLLIYDIIRYQDINMMKEKFTTRSDCIRKEIIEVRNQAILKNQINKERQPMSVRIKDFWQMEGVSKLFEPKFVENVGHEIDGLIFQPVNRPYTPGRCDSVLKWKPPSHNSVDFLLRIEKITKKGMLPEFKGLLYVLHQKDPFGMMIATRTLQKYDNKIIECTLELDQTGRPKEWKFMRERTDKSAPNALKTAQNVFETMTNPVTKEYLCGFISHICNRPPAQKRPRHE
ncbi:unnamed protein product [Caenorhabditis angaria]|uniref:mRNA-capping enzyme n=1 Tax=Caenorhabditis angaria TaxID=860376 RepID=A0A9P1MSP6_9PELO|nr:unnamed protein product [Caenorhabditis angaria]